MTRTLGGARSVSVSLPEPSSFASHGPVGSWCSVQLVVCGPVTEIA
jgi:hypothetical protein